MSIRWNSVPARGQGIDDGGVVAHVGGYFALVVGIDDGPRTIGREWPATPGISGRYGVVFHTCDRLTVLRDEAPFNRGSLRKGIAGAVAKVMIPRH
jgi:hypothetical protein